MKLAGKKILLGVSGSIAAYKSALLVRLLVKAGAEVRVILTQDAAEFITPLTLATLSKNPVLTEFAKPQGEWNNHVELGLWADVFLIAPATANTLAKCAAGMADNLLIATYLSARCPVFFAPAMDLDMYQHPSTQQNLRTLVSYQNHIIEAQDGELASGLHGQGRLAEPEHIIRRLERHFGQDSRLAAKKIVITAGPTQEDIDPVRFISNHSSGKMGVALAEAFYLAGADVTLVAGPLQVAIPEGVMVEKVRSAQEMYDATHKHFADSDIVIFAAAVADYAPKEVATVKLKKKADDMQIELRKTIDIAATLAPLKRPTQIMMGFALETNDERANALGKLERKNFDVIALNSLQDKGAGFRYDTNKITLLTRTGEEIAYELKSKEAVAEDIKEFIIKLLEQKSKLV